MQSITHYNRGVTIVMVKKFKQFPRAEKEALKKMNLGRGPFSQAEFKPCWRLKLVFPI